MNIFKRMWNSIRLSLKSYKKENNSEIECGTCEDTGLMRYEGSPSKSLMGVCEHCDCGKE